MWQVFRRSHESQSPCTMEHIHGSDDVVNRRCTPQTSSYSHTRRPYLHFPPPPAYPPPNRSMAEDHLLSLPGPSTDYSYAYYEPGPPTRHHNVPHRYLGGAGSSRSYREGSYRSKHTYLTRYGTEENIYEEISEVARARMRPVHQESMISLNQSLVEEEVRRVQHGHRRVLGELNLSVEAMLMPSSSREGSDDTETEVDDQLADLFTVGPTDELLSPVPLVDLDSGFSGSSSGASYRSTAGSLRRGLERPKSTTVLSKTQIEPTQNKGFWSRKGWKKLGFSSSSLHKNKEKEKGQIGKSAHEQHPERLNSNKIQEGKCEYLEQKCIVS